MKLKMIFATAYRMDAAVLRIVAGVVIFSHGAQNMLGWFGGSGLEATLQALTTYMGLSWLVALSVVCIQFFGSIMLMVGAGTRLAALGVIGIFIGMITYHVDYGFHMNWMGTKAGEGFEYHVLVIGMMLALLVSGGGAWSVDKTLQHRMSS